MSMYSRKMYFIKKIICPTSRHCTNGSMLEYAIRLSTFYQIFSVSSVVADYDLLSGILSFLKCCKSLGWPVPRPRVVVKRVKNKNGYICGILKPVSVNK